MESNPNGGGSISRHTLAGERRVVTILFSDVYGSTAMAEHLDPEDWAEIMNEAFEYLTEPINRYGGTVARLMGDSVLAFFGAPVAHEDDPLRAVLAGLDIVSGLKAFRERVAGEYDLDFSVRVGINTGVVVVGEMGSALAGEYTAMGDAVNLAARMEQSAKPGTIQITGETYHLVAPWIEVESLGGIEVKGKSIPVQAYCVLGRKAQPDRARGIVGLTSPLVGRDQEYARLKSVLADLDKRGGQIITLIGEAGLGKSRLIEEMQKLHNYQSAGSIQWIECHGISYETARPYGLFIQALRQICQITEEDPPDVIHKKVVERFSDLNHDKQSGITNTVKLLLSVKKNLEGIDPHLEGEALKREIFESMLNIWSGVANKNPLIFVFDDLHWADSSSVDLLIHLFQLADRFPILFLCAMRPHRATSAWQVKIEAERDYPHRYHEISLSPLDEKDGSQLVDNLLLISDLPAELRDMILRKSEGNPFFLEEVVRSLIDSGKIQRDKTGLHWQATTNFEQIDIPDNLQALLLARIDRLESGTRHSLQLASVIGRSFYYRILQAITDRIDDLDDELITLQHIELIQETVRQPELEYIFRHELIRDASYQSILRRQRQEYHRKVGEAIEKIFPEKTEEEAHRLAYHFNMARDYGRALKYFIIAGDQSLKLFANHEASQFYRRAIDIALKLDISNEQLVYLYTNRGRALELLNQYDQALENYEELEGLGRARSDRRLELAGMVPKSIIYSTPTVRFNPHLGVELSQQTLELARALRDYDAEAKSLWSLMLIKTLAEGDIEKAIEYGEQGLEIANQHKLWESLAFIQHDIARAYMRAGRMKDSRDAYESSQVYWRKNNNLPMLADNLASLAESDYITGEFERSLEHAKEGLLISQKIGNTWGEAYNNFAFGPVLLERGDIDASLEALKRTLELSKRANFAAGVVGMYMIQTWIYAMFGDLQTASQIQQNILAFVEQYDSFKPLFSISQALNKLYSGFPDEALILFEEVGRRYGFESELLFQPYIFTLHVEIYLSKGDYDLALQTAGDYLKKLKTRQVKLLVPDLLDQNARALIALGRKQEAYHDLQAAHSLAVEQESKRIMWAILIDLSEVEEDPSISERYRTEARQVIEYIAAHISDSNLRGHFLSLPNVSTVL